MSTFSIISCNTQIIFHANSSYLHRITVKLMFCKLFHTRKKQGNGYYNNVSNNKSVRIHVTKAFKGRAVLLGHWAPQPWKLKSRKKTLGSTFTVLAWEKRGEQQFADFFKNTFNREFSVSWWVVLTITSRLSLKMTLFHKEWQVWRRILKRIKEDNKTVHRLSYISNFTNSL